MAVLVSRSHAAIGGRREISLASGANDNLFIDVNVVISGFAWGENIGWIDFGSGNAFFGVSTSWEHTPVNRCDSDFDQDGDVDGRDLATLLESQEFDKLKRAAEEFGTIDSAY